ncbi:MAG TPA: gamma-glutamyl-gamma-aminobutyrate hydrolase family protein [Candidatus Sulfotelmatobacter sp.]|jgi:GMP synthase-like glutamine amidotransferase|nr:gamma-glutamyl-gamma-aminobutyrate hydrolase family protein [Candidatus Sulfotelmatobacter sp.]
MSAEKPYLLSGIERGGEKSASGLVERLPSKAEILLLVAEPKKNLGKFAHTVPDPEGSIYAQWTGQSHGVDPKRIHTHHLVKNMPLPDLSSFAVVMAGGATSSVNDESEWMNTYLAGLKTIVASGIPTLVNCHGLQALIKSFGGEVGNNAVRARKFGVGQYRLTKAGREHWAFDGMPTEFPAFRSHKQETLRMPPDWDVLARDQEDGIAAVGIKNSKVVGLQWHTDLTHAIMVALSRGRIPEIEDIGTPDRMSYEEFLKKLQQVEPEVMGYNRIISRNLFQQADNM